MLCYRDRTYCMAPCAVADCDRKLTPEVEVAALKIGVHVAIADLRDVCPKYTPKRKDADNG